LEMEGRRREFPPSIPPEKEPLNVLSKEAADIKEKSRGNLDLSRKKKYLIDPESVGTTSRGTGLE